MKLSKWQFWITFAVAVPVGVFFWGAYNVGVNYHPGAVRGDLLNPLKQVVPLGILLTPVIVVIAIRLRPGIAGSAYGRGALALVFWALLPILPSINNGHKVAKCIDGQRYEIPWQYNSSEMQVPCEVNTGFGIHVSLPDLLPRYAGGGTTVITKSSIHTQSDEPDDQDMSCEINWVTNQVCRWNEAGSAYQVYMTGGQFPELTPELWDQIVELMDSFAVPDG